MIISNIDYKIKTASKEQIYLHLSQCNYDFIPPLDEKVNVEEYAWKLYTNAVLFEAWIDDTLSGLIAAYFNDKNNITGYITNVSVVRAYKGKGIASHLLSWSIDYAKQNNFKEILLEVHTLNYPAIKLYKKVGFTLLENKGELNVMKLKLEA